MKLLGVLLAFTVVLPCLGWNQPLPEHYLGIRAGRMGESTGSRGGVIGYGIDARTKVGRAAYLGIQVQSSPLPSANDQELYSFGLNLEFLPIRDLSDIRASLGVGPGLYHFTHANGTYTRVGGSFGATVDVVFDGFTVGFSSRYHAIINPVSELPDLLTAMVRMGLEFD